MIFPGIKRIAKELGLQRTDSVAVGLIGNCHACLYDGNHVKVLDITFPEITEELRSRLSPLLGKRALRKVEWIESMLRVTFFEIIWPYSAEKIKQLALGISEVSSQLSPEKMVPCKACNTTTNVATHYSGTSIFWVCDTCAEKIKDEYKQAEIEYKSKPGRYHIATAFGLVCSIPGVFVSAGLFIFMSKIAALSSIIFILLILWGYRKANGKIDKVGAILIIAAGAVMTLVGTWASYLLNLVYNTRSLNETIQLLALPEVQSELNTNLVISGLVSALYLALQMFELQKAWRFPELRRAYEFKK